MKWLYKNVPITSWLPQYTQLQWKGDLSAGLTVGVVLIPQGLAYAMLAGLPPIYGLYAAIIPPILYVIFGTSRHLMVGPVALDSMLVAAGLGTLAIEGTAEYIQLAILLALCVGLIQLTMGVFRLGFLVNFLSRPIITGFTAAAALIIGFSQLKHLLGIRIDSSNYVYKVIESACQHIEEVNLPTLLLGLAAIVIIKLSKRFRSRVPGPLLAVLFGILVVWGFGLDQVGVRVIGEIPKGIPYFALPEWSSTQVMELLPIAGTIAFISIMESSAIAKGVQFKRNDYRISPNQELIGLGMANIGASLFRTFSVSASFSRTAINEQVGGQTGISAIISAAFITLTLFFLTPYLFYLPHTILASVIIVSVLGLIDPKEWRYLWQSNRTDFWMLLITFVGTLLLGIKEGILIGVGLSIGLVIFQTTRPHMAILGKIPGEIHYKNVNRFDQLEVRNEILIIRFDARLYFANVAYFLDTVEEWMAAKGPELALLIIEADSINDIDSSGVRTLETLVQNTESKGIKLFFANVKGPVRDALKRAGFMEKMGTDKFFYQVQNAVDYYDQKPGDRYLEYATQTNN
ncbi:MAG: solute carrier family 26 protein [Bacteroidota bacterium]